MPHTMPLDRRKMAGLLLFVGVAQFTVGLMVAAALTPGYSIADNFISDLGVLEGALVFNGSIILLGALVVGASYFLHRVYGRPSVTVPVLLAGIGAAGVGVFTEDFPLLHALFSLLTFVAAGLAAVLVSRVLPAPLSVLSVLLGVASLVALGLFLGGTRFGLDDALLGLGVGGMERMIVLPVMAWGMGLGGYLMAAPEAPSG